MKNVIIDLKGEKVRCGLSSTRPEVLKIKTKTFQGYIVF